MYLQNVHKLLIPLLSLSAQKPHVIEHCGFLQNVLPFSFLHSVHLNMCPSSCPQDVKMTRISKWTSTASGIRLRNVTRSWTSIQNFPNTVRQMGRCSTSWNIIAGCNSSTWRSRAAFNDMQLAHCRQFVDSFLVEGLYSPWAAPRQIINITSLLKVRCPSHYAVFGEWIFSTLPTKFSLNGDWWLILRISPPILALLWRHCFSI